MWGLVLLIKALIFWRYKSINYPLLPLFWFSMPFAPFSSLSFSTVLSLQFLFRRWISLSLFVSLAGKVLAVSALRRLHPRGISLYCRLRVFVVFLRFGSGTSGSLNLTLLLVFLRLFRECGPPAPPSAVALDCSR